MTCLNPEVDLSFAPRITSFAHRLDKMRTRRPGTKTVGEILRFVGHQPFAKFHDAHRVGWYAIIGQHEFGDPEIAAADHSPDRKTLLVRLDEPALLNVVPASDSLARLRIIKYGILAVDFMLDVEIARVRGIPMALQRRPQGLIIHLCHPSDVLLHDAADRSGRSIQTNTGSRPTGPIRANRRPRSNSGDQPQRKKRRAARA